MNTRQMAEEYRLAHWAGILQERKESGLGVKAFCEKAGFHQNIYFYWQRKLREAACRELQPVANAGKGEALVPQGWALCEKRDTAAKESGISIEIGKCRINVGKKPITSSFSWSAACWYHYVELRRQKSVSCLRMH